MPDNSVSFPPLFFNTWSQYTSTGNAVLFASGATATVSSGNWSSANLAMYIPFWLPWPYPVRRMFWCVGGTGGGNADIGIYNDDGTRIVSAGSTAQSGTNTLQYVTPTETLLSPGNYYLGMTFSGTTGVAGVVTSTALRMRAMGIVQQATSLPLPATMTPATLTSAVFPFCGFTLTSSGF